MSLLHGHQPNPRCKQSSNTLSWTDNVNCVLKDREVG